jgi:predicted RNase H-like HicB family nuclease
MLIEYMDKTMRKAVYEKLEDGTYSGKIPQVLRKSGLYWVALCLENGLVGQGTTKDDSIKKLKEAIECFEEECKKEGDVYNAPISVKELHEFLTVPSKPD